MDAQQFSDVPDGYKVLPPNTPPPAFSDVPDGYKVLPPAPAQTLPAVNQAIATVPKPQVPMKPEALNPLSPEERTSGQFAPAPGTELEHEGALVPQAAVPALQAIQTHVTEPLNRMGAAAAKAGGEAAEGFASVPESAAPFTGAPPSGHTVTGPERIQQFEKESPIVAGLAKGAGEVVGGTIGDPRNWPFLASGSARPALQKIISLGFSGQMGKGAVDTAIDLHANWDKYTPAERAEKATNAGISGLLAIGGAVHATHGRPEAITPVPADRASLTTEARDIVNSAGMEFPYNPTADDLKASYRQYQARAANAAFADQPAMAEKSNRLKEIYDQLNEQAPGGKYSDVPEGYKLLPPAESTVHHTSNDVEDLRASAERQAPKVGDAVAHAAEGVPGAKVEAVRDSKDTDRIEDKAARQGVQPSQIGDIAAAKVSVPDQAAANKVLENLHQQMPVQSAEGTVTGEPQNNAVRQTQAIVDTKAPAGEPVRKAEVMLQTPEMAKATESTHDDYRKAQELRAAGKEAEAGQLEDQIARTHEAAEQDARARQGEPNAQSPEAPREAAGAPGENHPAVPHEGSQAPGQEKEKALTPGTNANASPTPGQRELWREPDVKEGVDFDGTLFTENADGSIGQPIPERVASLKQRVDSGEQVVIESKRAGHPGELAKMQDALESVGLPRLPITPKKTAAPELVDDKITREPGVKVDHVTPNANTPLPSEYGPPKADFGGKVPHENLGFNPNPAEDFGNKTRAEVERRMGGALPRGQGERRAPDAEADRLKQIAQPARDTGIMDRLKKEHPEWTDSQRLMEAAKQANPGGSREAQGEKVASPVLSGARKQNQEVTPADRGTGVPSETGPEPKYKFGNTQANIPAHSEAAKGLEIARSIISGRDLAGKGTDVGDGGNHVTVRYGIDGDDTDGIKKFLSQQAPFEGTLGKTEKFPPSEHSDGAAVIIAPINAPELHRLNSELEKHGNFTKPSFKEYKPHATIAYVDPAKADRYVGMTITQGKKFTINSIAIADREGNQQVVKLEGRRPGQAPVPPTKKAISVEPVKPDEPERVVPGARSATTGKETKTNSIQDLTDAISHQVPDKRPLKDRIQRGASIGENQTDTKNPVVRALDRVKGASAALWDAYNRPPRWNDYEDATGNWSGADQVNAHDLHQFTEALRRAVPTKTMREAISNWIEAGGDEAILRDRADHSKAPYKVGYEAALNLTDAEKTIARNVMNRNDATLEEAQKAGLLQQGVENYVRHVYEDSPKYQAKVAAEMNFASLKTNPSFTKERKIPTYFDAEQLGFKPKDKDVGYLTAIHERSFREALAARDYVKSLMNGKAEDGRPLVMTSWASAKELEPKDGESSSAYLIKPNIKAEEESADYRKIDHPALRGWRWAGKTSEGEPIFVQGDALVHPEIYRKLKNNLTKSAIRSYETEILGHTVRPGNAVLNASAEIKHAILSFSGFHQTTLATHAAEHRTLPAGMPELDFNQPKQRALVDHGLMVAQYDAEEAFGEGVASGGLVTKIPGAGPLYGRYTNYLFHDYLPRVKMATGLNALERNMQRYEGKLTQDQIEALTAAQTNASFGGLNYRMLGRNKTIQDVLRLGLMAPDFFEARARYAGQAAKPYGREQLTALIGGAMVLYTIGRILNEITDNDPHWDKPFSVVYRDKEYSMRTIQEEIFRAVTTPGKYLMARISPTVATAIHLGEGRNEFGRKQSVGEVMKNAVKQEVPIPLQPWTRESKDSTTEKVIESIAKMVGVNVRAAHEASEERLRDKEREGREVTKELKEAETAGDQEAVEKIENDPAKQQVLGEHEAWAGYLDELRSIDRQIKELNGAKNISGEDRRAGLAALRDARRELLKQSDESAKRGLATDYLGAR